jgi:hypothetical protein
MELTLSYLRRWWMPLLFPCIAESVLPRRLSDVCTVYVESCLVAQRVPPFVLRNSWDTQTTWAP